MENNWAFTVSKSTHCCAIYELAGVHNSVIDSRFVEAVKDRAKKAGNPKVLPLVIVFSDSDSDRIRVNYDEYPPKQSKESSRGLQLYNLLKEEGYRVDRLRLGKNPKSDNNVSMYLWWTHKGKGKSKDYEQEEQESDGNKSGGSPASGVQSGRVRGPRRGFLRLGRRTGT